MTPEPMVPPPQERPGPGPWWKLQGIFFEPAATFQAIRQKPNWLVPLLATTVLGVCFWFLVLNVVGVEDIVRVQIEQSGRADQLSEEELGELLDRVSESSLILVQFYGMALIAPALASLLVAGILMLGLILAGGETTFSHIFSVVCHSFFLTSAATMVLAAAVLVLLSDPSNFSLQNPVSTNPAALVSRRDSPVLYSFLSSIDLISFYGIYLLGSGLSTGTRLSFGTATGMVVGFWGLYVLIFKVGLVALFS